MHSSCSHGLSHFFAFLHIHAGNHLHEVDFYTLHLQGLLLFFSDSTLFSLLGSLELSLLLFLLLLLVSNSLLFGELSLNLFKTLLVLLPSLNLWNLVNADGLGVWLEEMILFVFEHMVARFFGESDNAVRVRFRTLLEVTEFVIVDTTISVLASLPEGSQTDNDLADLPDWVPGLWMVIRDRKADTFIPGVEATVSGLHNNFWSLSWVLLWADNFTHVEATFPFLVVKAEDNVVPGVDVLWVWKADEAIVDLTSLLDLGLDVLLSHLAFSLESHLTCLVSLLHFVFCVKVF